MVNYKNWLEEYYDEILEDWKDSGRKQSFKLFAFNKYQEKESQN